MNTLDRPTVLLVGTGERMKDALADALERHRLMVESVSTERAVEAAFAAAPDLVVLIGDATLDGGRKVLARLSQSPATATVPVVLLTDEAGLDRRLDAFRHGVVAVVPKTASADGMARRVAEVSRELPERPGETGGELGEATVDELVELFSQQLRTGILSVTAGGEESAQVVLRAGRPVTEAIEELVERLRPLVRGQSGPLRYEFHESTSARLTLLEAEESEPEDTALLRGRRILVVEQNPARADVLVQELRAEGALVVVADGQGTGLERAQAQDPEVVVIDGSGVHGWALPTLRALRRDPRLRWASLLVVDAAELWPRDTGRPDLGRLAASLKPLVRPGHELTERAAREKTFDTRLEVIGPSRMLRALTATGLGLRVSVSHSRARIEVDLAEGLVAGARALAPATGAQMGEGPAALAALLALGSGRVRVERKDAPAVANIMAPVDDALAAAAREKAPIAPSIPPPSAGSEPPAERASQRAAPQDAEKLVGRLEQLLERLQRVLPAAEAAAMRTEDEPATKPLARAPKAAAVPPPRGALPPARGAPRRPTLALGSAAEPASEEAAEDDDLPVIEGTAVPGPRAVVPSPSLTAPTPAAPSLTAPTPAPSPAVPSPAAVVPVRVVGGPEAAAALRRAASMRRDAEAESAKAASSGGNGHALTPFAMGALASSTPSATSAPSMPSQASDAVLTTPSPAPPVELAHAGANGALAAPVSLRDVWETEPSPGQRPERRAAPIASDDDALPVRKSRGPLWFAIAFVATLAIGGSAALYLHFAGDAQPDEPGARATLPPSTPEPTAVAPSADPPAPAPVAARDAGSAPAPDAGLPVASALGAPEVGLDVEAVEAPLAAIDEDPAPSDEPDEPTSDEPAEAPTDSRSASVARLIRMANYDRNHGELRSAETSYLRVLSLERDNARALAGLVRLNMARHNDEAAVRWARRLVAARPRNASNHVLLGDALEAAGNHRAAVRAWQEALAMSPGLSAARTRLGAR